MYTEKGGFLILQNNIPKLAIVGSDADANNAAMTESTRTGTPITTWSKLPILIRDRIPDKAESGNVRVEIPKWSDPNFG